MIERFKNITKFPVLTNLMIYQVLVILIGCGVLFISSYMFSHSSVQSAIDKQKEHILPQLESKQEQWRTWKYMGLSDALQQSIQKFESAYQLEKLLVIERNQLPKKLGPFAIVVPEKADPIITNVVYGELSQKALQGIQRTNKVTFILILCLGVGFVGVIFLSGKYIYQHMYEPILELNDILERSRSGKKIQTSHIKASGEIRDLMGQVNDLLDTTRKYERTSAVGELSSQIAHDIRSPLSALKMAVSRLSELPEDRRLLIRSAVQRINDITHDLGAKNKRAKTKLQNLVKQKSEDEQKQKPEHCLLSSVIESLVSEKRMQFRKRPEVDIEFRLEENSYALFVAVIASEFKLILSNLINNSMKSIVGAGKIQLILSRDQTKARLIICDSGVGIPPEKLPNIIKRGVNISREDSAGFGLYHAHKYVRSWGGEIKIDSQVNQGTIVSIVFPLKPRPKWIAGSVDYINETRFFILDDDPSIHQIWESRLNEIEDIDSMRIIHFKTPEEFFTSQATEFHSKDVFLFDHELLGFSKTGLDVIRELGVQKQSILVTSHFENQDLRRKCLQEGIELLPKSLAEYIPIKKERVAAGRFENPDCILIDDDELVHVYWKNEAQIMGKKVASYKHPQEFLSIAHHYHKSIPIYVDSNLSDGIKGEDVSKEIRALGFENVYIATGLDASEFPPMSWIKGIVGKNPPWDKLN